MRTKFAYRSYYRHYATNEIVMRDVDGEQYYLLHKGQRKEPPAHVVQPLALRSQKDGGPWICFANILADEPLILLKRETDVETTVGTLEAGARFEYQGKFFTRVDDEEAFEKPEQPEVWSMTDDFVITKFPRDTAVLVAGLTYLHPC